MREFFRRHRLLILALALVAPALWFASHQPALAQGAITSGEILNEEIGTTIGTGTQDIRITIARIIRVAFGLLGTIALLLILYAGFLWMTAAGDDSKITSAKKTLTAAIIGLVIMLSAFAITSFIINSLVSATGGFGTDTPGGGGGGGGGFGSSGGAFRPTAIQPGGSLAKYDVFSAVTFSAAPTSDIANIRANLRLEKVEGSTRTAVDYEPVVENNSIRLRPLVPCPAPNEDRRCLEPDSDYQITVSAGLKNASGSSSVTCGLGAICTRSFRTGDAVTTELPTIAIQSPGDGEGVPTGSLVPIQALMTDQNGIATVEYSVDGAFFSADGNAQTIAPSTFSSQTVLDTTPYAPVKTVTLRARVINIDGDEATSANVRVVVRPAHCFNGVEDGDETAVDCGGSCGSCTGGTCTDNAACASGLCVGGQCVENPQITDVQLRDGKPGNLVTITGARFGSIAGKVVFLGGPGADDDTEADLGACAEPWSSVRVVVAVPEGAVTGPIALSTSGGKTDATNDTYGPIITDFQINDTARPGICGVSPTSIKTGQTVSLTGRAFGATQAGSRVQFARAGSDCSQIQDWSQAAEAATVSPWSETAIGPTVPNVETGASGANYLTRVVVDGQPSNTACLLVLPPEAGTEPRIDFLTPEDGSVGTYMTVFGSNFGSGGTVRFTSAAGEAVGDISFPAQCAAGYWTNAAVTVKVPARFTVPANTAMSLGAYDVTVVRSDGRVSNTRSFTLNTDPLPPGICRIDPDNGPAGTSVSLYGDGFGEIGASDLSAFMTLHPDAVRFHDGQNAASVGQWRDSNITATVPEGAVTGPARVRTFVAAGTLESNGANFQVRDCRESGGDASCGTGRTCCDDGACRASCGASAAAGGFAWQFSTGPIPVFPIVIENATCQLSDPSTMPSPNPFKGATDVCTDIGTIAVRFSLPMDSNTLNVNNVELEACGSGATISSTCATVAGAGSPQLLGDTLMTLSTGGGLAADTWYRLTISDQVRSTDDLPNREAQQLDGDFDSRGGGAYVTTFKTGTGPCVISGLNVEPSTALIAGVDETEAYAALPLSARCIILSCTGRSVAWSSSDAGKATVASLDAGRQCDATATPVSETEPGPAIEIGATVDGFDDAGLLTIDYANPRVVEYGPRDCDQACINAVAFAYFNTPMAIEGPGSILSNVAIRRCLNESCLTFADTPEGMPIQPSYNAAARLLTFGNPDLAPNTYYRVYVHGTAVSTSGAPLTGLNFENASFSWTFRTRQSANPCGPQSIRVEPQQTTLRYIGAVSQVSALPRSSPDACAANGQILSSSSFNWGWTKTQTPADPVAFRYLPDVPPGALLNTNPVLPSGCSTACVMTGSKPPGTPRCGNGTLEKGEACDTPNLNGCNSVCLLTGNTAENGCGDGDVRRDEGEECDAGAQNGAAGSGCTSACLLTGSSPGLSSCGNGSEGVGEACDDGNTASGDGCGSACTLEGSSQTAYVCGNGDLEPGEQCDYVLGATGLGTELLISGLANSVALGASDEQNPTRPGFACGTSCLLRGNSTACTSGAGCCGNGVIDYAKGEGCDAGADNGDPASGCSSVCTKTGSHPELRAYCGDGGVPTVKPADPLTGVQNGGGEECEATGPDANIDALQVVEALAQCDARNTPACSATVSASIGTVRGDGSVSVECACRNDSDCSAFGSNLSCGAGACCYKRPSPPDINPKGGDECRNALVTVTFGELMDIGSLQGGIIVESCSGAVTRSEGGNWLARAFDSVGRFLRSLVGATVTAQAVCAPVEGVFQHATDAGPTGDRTISKFVPKQLYDENRDYRVTVRGGLTGAKTIKGVGYTGDTAQVFKTGVEICDFDVAEVDPASELIQTADTPLPLTATAMTNRNGELEPIAPIAGVYDWTWSWATVPEATPPGTILELTAGSDPSATVRASKGLNGREQVVASARIVTDVILTPTTVGKTKAGISQVTVMLCEQPWPSRAANGAWTPYVDPATHFEFYYCRDNAGAALPELMPLGPSQPVQGQSGADRAILRFCKDTVDDDQPRSCQSDADCGVGDQCLSKDVFFRFDPSWKLSDVIGVRAYDNPNRLTPQEWYESQLFSGKTQPTTVDGYAAVQAERTVYVGAVDKYGDPELRSYTYVFAYNDRADARTAEVFNRLLKNVRFNTNLVPSDRVTNVCKTPDGEIALAAGPASPPTTCSSDLDCFAAFQNPPAGLTCDSDKDKLRRDMRRWQDMRNIEAALEETFQGSGSYPQLESGSFIRGFTTSSWPSWSRQLGAAGAIVDPLNRFNRCEAFGSECVISRTACAADGDCEGGTGDVCRVKFDSATCYNDRASVFACPDASHVYQYRSIGGQDYAMNVGFEYTAYPWTQADCTQKEDASACEEAVGCSWLPTGPGGGSCQTRISTTSTCSGLFTDGTNRCLATGVPGVACSESSTCAAGDSCVPSNVPLFGPAAASVCGNGLVEGAEMCEIGMSQVVACEPGRGSRRESCKNDCTGWAIVQDCPATAQCGNGSLETFAGESCDDGAQTGQYGRCRAGDLGCKKRCVNITKRPATDFDADRDIRGTCFTNAECDGLPFDAICTDRHSFCGDGRRTGPELCDDGELNGQYGQCAWDCRGAGPRCGDLETNGAEMCDGNQLTASGVCIDTGASLADTSTISGDAQACARDADCGAGKKCALCGVTAGGLPQTRSKSCFPATAPVGQACTFDSWGACKQSGACGNGKVEGAEQCDEGTANSTTGACLPSCRRNICNDGFVHAGVEQCDNGASNGVLCLPKYGLTCNYCDNACAIKTLTGGFCGDGVFQNAIASPPGPEQCDDMAGLANSFVCVSTKPEHQSYGRIVGFVACSVNNCQQSCAEPQSRVCDNAQDTVNSDRYGGAAEACPPGDSYCASAAMRPYRSVCPAPEGAAASSCVIAPTGDPRYDEQTNVPSSAVVLNNVCDPDDDNDGVPDEFDCGPTAATVHAAYKYPSDGSVINIPYHPEICDVYDNDCNGAINDSPDLHTAVDMVFTIDISGSMQGYIDGIANAISRFVGDYEGTDHRFALVVFGQTGGGLQTDGGAGGGRRVIGLTTVSNFQNAIDDLLANGGAYEPMYRSVIALADAENMPLGDGGSENGTDNPYGIVWRDNAHPYIVLVTDEPAPAGGGPGPHPSEANVAAAVSKCEISGCEGKPGYKVETFVIGRTGYISQWDSILHNEVSDRFIEIAPAGLTGTALSNHYFAELSAKTFSKVCAASASFVPTAEVDDTDWFVE